MNFKALNCMLFAVMLILSLGNHTLANEPSVKAILAEIVKTHVPSTENETRLTTLFQHADLGVRTSAKIRIAELYWKTGRFEQAEAVLNGLGQEFDTLSAKYQVEYLLTWASFELRRNNHTKTEEYAKKAAEIAKRDHQALLKNAYFILGNGLNFQKKRLEAMQNYELALALFQESNDPVGTFLVLNSLGVMYKSDGDLVNGTKYLLQARETVEQTDSLGYRASINYNLGDIFIESGEPHKAIGYYQKALEFDIKLGDLGNVAFDYTGLASAHLALDQPTLALKHNQQAIEQLLKLNAPQELSRTYLQQSRIYRALQDDAHRLKSLQLAEQSAAKANSPYQFMSINIDKAQYFLDHLAIEQARDHLLQAKKSAQTLDLENKLLEINQLLATTFQQLKDYERAYSHLNASFELQKRLDSEDRREKSERYKLDINLLEEQLKVSQLEHTEAQQSQALKEQESIKMRLFVIMIAGVIVFLALTFLLVQRRKLALLKADLLEQALQQKQQLFADVSHELRTPLSALKLQIQALQCDLITNVEDSYDKLDRKVNEINRLISDIYQLAKADTQTLELTQSEVALAPLFDRWQSDWQNIVEANQFNWQCELVLGEHKKRIDTERIKQVIDNLLSNAIAYTNKPGTIAFYAGIHNNQLMICLEDSAPTVDTELLDKIFTRLYRVESSRSRQTGGSGLGLAICESLIKAHGGTIYAEQSTLGGLKVIITI